MTKLEKLKAIRNELNKQLTVSDVDKIMEFIKLKFAKTDKETKDSVSAFSKTEVAKIVKEVDRILSTVKRGKRGSSGERGQSGRDGKDGRDGQGGRDGLPGVDGRDGLDGIAGLDGKDVEESAVIDQIEKDIPKLGFAVRDALELLTGRERLDIKYIKGWKKALAAIKKETKIFYAGGGGGAEGGRTVLSYDIYDQLDGSTKTFTLPAFWRVISVHSSSFPNAFRATTDYTTDASAMTITFTSEINAATTLATGQTVTIVYSQP